MLEYGSHRRKHDGKFQVRLSAHAEFVGRLQGRPAMAADQCSTVSASKRIGNFNRTFGTVKNVGRLGSRFHLEVNVA
jgi:hypothetical protein